MSSARSRYSSPKHECGAIIPYETKQSEPTPVALGEPNGNSTALADDSVGPAGANISFEPELEVAAAGVDGERLRTVLAAIACSRSTSNS